MWKFLNLLFCLCWGVIILRLLYRNRQLFEKPGAVWIPLLAVFAMVLLALLLLFSDPLLRRVRNPRRILHWSWCGLSCLFLVSLGILAPILL